VLGRRRHSVRVPSNECGPPCGASNNAGNGEGKISGAGEGAGRLVDVAPLHARRNGRRIGVLPIPCVAGGQQLPRGDMKRDVVRDSV
jgi:hypothetical protein